MLNSAFSYYIHAFNFEPIDAERSPQVGRDTQAGIRKQLQNGGIEAKDLVYLNESDELTFDELEVLHILDEDFDWGSRIRFEVRDRCANPTRKKDERVAALKENPESPTMGRCDSRASLAGTDLEI